MLGSMGHVNSKILKVLLFTSSTVMSGLKGVIQTSNGIVPHPGAVNPSRSIKTLYLVMSRQVEDVLDHIVVSPLVPAFVM